MPFDGTNFAPIVVPVVKPFDFDTATGDERLLELARKLEAEQEWRNETFRWNFCIQLEETNCGTMGCAIGLARVLWPLAKADFFPGTSDFNLTETEWADLFSWNLPHRLNVNATEVTPGMVATAIRQFVAKRSAS